MRKYQEPETAMTLESGLEEYYGSRADLLVGRGMSSEAQEFFRCHDTAHVVFGCDTTLIDEAVVKLWSFFGTTRGLRLLREYRLPESQEIYAGIEWGPIASTALRSVTVAPRVIARCTRMNKRWPWSDFEKYKQVPLQDLRREYGIRVLIVE